MASVLPLIAECATCGHPFLGGEVDSNGEVRIGIGPTTLRAADQGMTIGSHAGTTRWSGVELKCPRPACDGWGTVPDGFVDWFRGAVTLLTATPREHLNALVDALRARMAGEITDEQVVEAAPPATQPWLREAIAKYHLNYLLFLILAILGAQSAIAKDVSAVDRALHKAIAAVSRDAPKPKRPPPLKATPPAAKVVKPTAMPNLNDPCWCGSGRKYRRCHRVDP